MVRSDENVARVLRGKPVSPGFAEGAAVVYESDRLAATPRRRLTTPEQVERERRRFREAVARGSAKLRQVRERVLAEFGQSEAGIFSAHLAMLLDKSFAQAVERRIERDRVNAEWAVEAEIEAVASRLDAAADEYFRDRNQDVRDVGRRLLRELSPRHGSPLASLPAQSIVVAEELLPYDTINLDRRHVAAIVTERGGATAHAAILGRALGVPAVTGVARVTRLVRSGDRLLVDGERGEVTLFPTDAARHQLHSRRAAYAQALSTALAGEGQECRTRDGVRIFLNGNIRDPAEADEVVRHHLDGVGLFRTEFMFMDAPDPPGYERQLEAYRRAADAIGGLPLTVRTLDLGGDKVPAFLAPGLARADGSTRGLRFSLSAARELFVAQLRAIVDVAQSRPVRILLPMVLGGDDLREAIAIIREVAGAAKVPPVGAMVETPAAIFSLEEILAQADFVSVGTNDLTQYMLAADRQAVDLMDAWSVLHPSVFRAISQAVQRCAQAGKPVSVCGESASEPALARLLVGLGVRDLSVSPTRAAHVRLALRRSDTTELRRLAEQIRNCQSMSAAREILQRTAGAPEQVQGLHDGRT